MRPGGTWSRSRCSWRPGWRGGSGARSAPMTRWSSGRWCGIRATYSTRWGWRRRGRKWISRWGRRRISTGRGSSATSLSSTARNPFCGGSYSPRVAARGSPRSLKMSTTPPSTRSGRTGSRGKNAGRGQISIPSAGIPSRSTGTSRARRWGPSPGRSLIRRRTGHTSR